MTLPLGFIAPSSAAGAWTPVGHPNVVAIYDARFGVLNNSDAAAADGEEVKTWEDQSGNEHHAVQPLTNRQRDYAASDALHGGNPSLAFPGGQTYASYVCPSFGADGVYILASYGDGTTATFVGLDMIIAGPGTASADRIGSGGSGQPDIFTVPGSIFTDAVTFDGDDGAGTATVLPMPFSLMVGKAASVITQTYSIGGSNVQSSRDWNGSVSAFVFTSGISVADGQRLEGWLAHEYGIAGNLVAGHPHKASPP